MYEIFEQLMKKKGASFSEIARQTGMRPSTLTDWRAGRYTPKQDKLQRIADYFGVSLEYLMTGKKDDDGYYLNPETAKIAQEMFEDKEIRSLFHMKRNMDPEKFQAHYEMMKKLYKMEHPEDDGIA